MPKKAGPKAKARAQRPAKQAQRAPRARKQRPTRGRARKIRLDMGILDARIGRHLSAPAVSGPYLVQRTRNVFDLPSINTATTILAFGAMRSGGELNNTSLSLTSCQAIGWQATTLNTSPAVTAWFADTRMAGYANAAVNCQLHAMTVEVRCFSTPTQAIGSFMFGALKSNHRRVSGETYADLASQLTSDRNMREFSYYEATMRPITVHTAPLDVVEWSMNNELVKADLSLTTGSEARLTDRLSPIYFVIPPSTGSNILRIRVYCEWRVVHNSDPMLRDAMSAHQPGTQAAWAALQSATHEAGGHFNTLSSAAQQAAQYVGPVLDVTSHLLPLMGV